MSPHASLFVLLVLPGIATAGSPDADNAVLNKPEWPVAVRFHGEIGFVAPLSHTIQFGQSGTDFDVVDELGQDTLFPFGRVSVDLDIGAKRRNTVSLLFQPLLIESTGVLRRDGVVDDLTFPAGTPTQFRYGFSFWRISYHYDILPALDKEVAFGASLQIRNARIAFRSEDGSLFRERRDVGPVPVLRFRGRGPIVGRFWMGGEVDGFYAPIRFLNGGASDVEGAIVDASLRFGLAWDRGVDTFLNLRLLGGGAQGTSDDPAPGSDGFNRNWLYTLALTLGVSLR